MGIRPPQHIAYTRFPAIIAYMPETPRALETFHPNELALYHRNPRVGNVSLIMDSLRAHGQYKPICVNRGTHTGRPYEVLAGNHTLKAFRDLLEQEPGNDLWTQVDGYVIDVDEDRAARIVLIDNRSAEMGRFDTEALAELLDGLPGLDGTGYAASDLDALHSMLEPPTDPYKEWEDMPHYEQEDGTPERSITVHFRDKETVQDFANLIDVPISDKARSIYFPHKERSDLTGMHYVGGEPDDTE